MPIIRTPDERFKGLVEFPFEPHYVEVNGLRVHYVDEGDGDPILCLHGSPSWSFLYRKMIPPLSAAHRVVALDLVGFGRSDKFSEPGEYSIRLWRDTVAGIVQALALEEITLVVHDWGGAVGLWVATDLPERLARLVLLNTMIVTGEEPLNDVWTAWIRFMTKRSDPPIGRIIRLGLADRRVATPDVIAAYEAPFPTLEHKAAPIASPRLIPKRPGDPGAAAMRRVLQALRRWTKPALVMFSDQDSLMEGGYQFFRNLIPSAGEQPEIVIEDAGHFLQEEKGEEIAGHILDFVARTA
jgi:haloalkane dehalogenase